MTKTDTDEFVVINDNIDNFYLICVKYRFKVFINNIIQYKKFNNLYTKYLTKNVIRNLKNIKINNNIAKEITKKNNKIITPPVTRKRNIIKPDNHSTKKIKYTNNTSSTLGQMHISVISNNTDNPQTLLNDDNLEYGDDNTDNHNFSVLCNYCIKSCCSCMYYVRKIAQRCCQKCKRFFKNLFK
jgi:hypothetical protein